MKPTQERIIEIVGTSTEAEAKKQLSEIYLLISQIGIGGYSKEKCFTDIENSYKQNIVTKILTAP